MNAPTWPTGGRSERPIDIVGLGETMVVVTPTARESLERADTCRLSIGGAESNVLMLLARAGLRTRFVTRVGDDPLGRRVLNEIVAAGVDLADGAVDRLRPTGVYFKDRGGTRTTVMYYRAGSAASTLDIGALASVGIHEAHALFVTGISPALSPTLADLVTAAVYSAVEHDSAVVFDVNYRPRLWSADEAAIPLLQLARRADVVFVGLDEAQALWKTPTAADVRELFGSWEGRLIVKDGAVGATEFHDGSVEFVPAGRVEVVEEIGAGDSFAAGYIAALFADSPSAERLSRGHRQAARALSSTGDVPHGVAL